MKVLSLRLDRGNQFESPEFHESKCVLGERCLRLESYTHDCLWENVGQHRVVGFLGLNQVIFVLKNQVSRSSPDF